MKKLIALSVVGLMAVPALATQASAHPAPYPHYHPVLIPTRTVIVHRRPRRRVIVHHRRTTRTVIIRDRRRRRSVVRRSYVRPVARRHVSQKLGMGLRAVTSIGALKLGLAQDSNPVMAGAGAFFKTKLTRNWGLELSIDALAGSGKNFTQTTVPVMGSVTYNFMPRSRIQPYVLAGVGANFSQLSYLDGKFKYKATELAGQLGAGVEVFITPTISLQADVRGQTVVKNLETQAQIRNDCIQRIGSKAGFCSGVNGANPQDKVTIGVTATVGATVYF